MLCTGCYKPPKCIRVRLKHPLEYNVSMQQLCPTLMHHIQATGEWRISPAEGGFRGQKKSLYRKSTCNFGPL